MSHVALVTCGGTIAMDSDCEGIRRPASSARIAALFGEISGLDVHASATDEIDSSQVAPSDWAKMLRALREAQSCAPAAIVVTHGTDTLAWTAGMLAAAGGWDVPVVLTGANTPAGDLDSDAVANLRAAAVVAASAAPGVFVAFAGTPTALGQVFQGGFVRKTRAGGAAFEGVPERLGHVRGGALEVEVPTRDIPFQFGNSALGRRVTVLRSHPALSVAPHRAALDIPALRPEVVVLELYACGTAPVTVVRFAADCVARGIPVLACPPAPISAGDAVYPSARELVDVGARVELGVTLELLVPFACSGGL